MARTFVHREHRLSDPAFLRDERQYLNRQWGTLHLMERQRDQLVEDIEEARALASQAGINPSPTTGVDGLKMLAVIGIGNRFRRDDGAGLEVARRLRLAHPPGVVVKEEEGEPKSLIDAWSGVDEALVIDAISSGSEPGTLHRYEVNEEPLPSKIFRSSTHAVGLAEAIELGRSLGRLPGRLVVFAIEGKSFEAGEGLTAPVQQVVADLVMDLYHELSGAS